MKKKNTHNPYTYNSGVLDQNSSPGPVPKEKEGKGTLETFQNERNNIQPPYTYNSGVLGLNPSPGPVSKEKERKETLNNVPK